jgi:hypothetical protein
MNNKFDELTKGMAQSATRRQALKKFGLGLAGMALACFGLASRAEARLQCPPDCPCDRKDPCITTVNKHCPNYDECLGRCALNCI